MNGHHIILNSFCVIKQLVARWNPGLHGRMLELGLRAATELITRVRGEGARGVSRPWPGTAPEAIVHVALASSWAISPRSYASCDSYK